MRSADSSLNDSSHLNDSNSTTQSNVTSECSEAECDREPLVKDSRGLFFYKKKFWIFCIFLSVLRIRDVYPGSRILIFTHSGSRIPDPKTVTNEKGEKKLVVKPFFCSHKFHKIVNYFIFLMLKKKIWASFQRIIELFTKIFVTKL
jgi:hypothetical protein